MKIWSAMCRPTVERICDFLGEKFEATMLDHTELARQLIAPTGHFEVEQPVSARTVRNWRQNMSTFDQKIATRLASSQLTELGYEVPDIPAFTPIEWIRYFALAVRFRVLDTTRRLLYRLGWLKMSRAKSVRRTTSQTASP